MDINQSVLIIAEPVRKPVLRDVVRSVFGRFHTAYSLRLVELCNRYEDGWQMYNERYKGLPVYMKRCTGKKWIRFRRQYLRIVKEETGDLVCAYCGKQHLFSDGNDSPLSSLATIDHIKPVSKGGRQFSIDNIVIACLECNMKKSNKDYTMIFMKKRNPIMYYLITLKFTTCKFLRSFSRF